MPRARSSRFSNVAAVALCALLLGCTQVRVYSNDAVAVHNMFGIADVNVTSPSDVSYVETSGFGLVLGSQHTALGWMSEAAAVFPDARKCGAMIVAKTPEDVEKIRELLKLSGSKIEQICLANGARQ
jgi:hypothetical protein